MRRLLAPLLLVVVLAACGGGGDDETVACPAVGDVGRITGVDVTADPPIESGGDVACSFTASDGITGFFVSMWRDPDATMSLLTDGLPDLESVDVGPATVAQWSPSTTTLYASDDDLGVTVVVVDVTEVVADPLAAATDLAELALG